MDSKRIKILAIDDIADNLVVLKALINDSFPDAVFITADSGRKGYELCQSERPDVVLLDVVMPDMDGYEVCSKIKADLRLRSIPVIMVTADRAEKESRIKALEAGADAFLPKPVDESELKAQIRAMLKIKKLEDLKKEEKEHLEDMVMERTEALELELADRQKAEKKLILTLDKITKNRQAIMNLMEDLKTEVKERKLVEENLQAERNLLRTLIDNLPDTIYVFDKECRKIIANKADVKIIGCESEADVLGKTDLEMFPGKNGERFYNESMDVLKTGIPKIDYEEGFIDRDGNMRFLSTSQLPLYDAGGQVIGLVGIGHDITNRKKAEENVRLKNKELQFLNKMATDLAAMVGEENLPAFLLNRLKEYTGSDFLVYSDFDDEKEILITRHIETDKKNLNRLIKISGDKILGNPAPINLNRERLTEIMTDVVSEKPSLNKISFGAIPGIVDKAFSAFTGINRYYGLSFVVGGELFGTAIMGFEKNQVSPSIELLKSFAHIAAVSLKRRRTEERLKTSQKQYRLVIENQGEGVGVVDLNENFIFVNPAAENMFGVEKGGLINRNLLDFVQDDNKIIVAKETRKRAKAEKSTYEINIVRPDGIKRTVLITATPQFSEDGKLSGTFGVFRDITERKNIEELLVKSEAYYRTLIDISPDGIIISDFEGNITYGSLKAFEIFGIPQGEKVTGISIFTLLSPDYQEAIMERVMEIMKGNIAPETREYKLRKFDRTIFWGELSSSPLSDAEGNPTSLIIVCRDISDRKKTEQELIKSRDKAEESDRLKTAFLHNISHEIRTPMNAIIGFSAMLGETDLDKDSQNSYIEIITQSSNHLLSIVSDIIEISNIEAGILKLNIKSANLNLVLNNLHRQFLPKAIEKVITFGVSTALPDSEANVLTDEIKLIQVLSSLISNAIKFTSSGRIEIGYDLKDDCLEFFVSDTGIGIQEEQHKRIFERFYQVENSITRLYEGTGLGLAISKAYVELLGGKIWLTSQPGTGSVFYFSIPYIGHDIPVDYEKKVTKSLNGNDIKKKTILIAEDEEDNFKLMVVLLSKLDFNLLHASNGREAVDMCAANKDIDLVVMDIKMPVMDGYEATGIIKKSRPYLPIIAQTAFAFESDREKSIIAGCDDYISKPLKKDILIELIKKYL